MTDRTSAVYAENETELWLIRLSVIYDKNKIEQQRDSLYKCSLCQKQYLIVVINHIGCWLWLIPDRNYVTDCTDMIYVENKTKLSWSIELGSIYNENQIG